MSDYLNFSARLKSLHARAESSCSISKAGNRVQATKQRESESCKKISDRQAKAAINAIERTRLARGLANLTSISSNYLQRSGSRSLSTSEHSQRSLSRKNSIFSLLHQRAMALERQKSEEGALSHQSMSESSSHASLTTKSVKELESYYFSLPNTNSFILIDENNLLNLKHDLSVESQPKPFQILPSLNEDYNDEAENSATEFRSNANRLLEDSHCRENSDPDNLKEYCKQASVVLSNLVIENFSDLPLKDVDALSSIEGSYALEDNNDEISREIKAQSGCEPDHAEDNNVVDFVSSSHIIGNFSALALKNYYVPHDTTVSCIAVDKSLKSAYNFLENIEQLNLISSNFLMKKLFDISEMEKFYRLPDITKESVAFEKKLDKINTESTVQKDDKLNIKTKFLNSRAIIEQTRAIIHGEDHTQSMQYSSLFKLITEPVGNLKPEKSRGQSPPDDSESLWNSDTESVENASQSVEVESRNNGISLSVLLHAIAWLSK